MAKAKLLIAVVAAALMSGCGGGMVPVNSPGSPLGTGGDPFQVCTANPSGRVMTVGAVLENHSSQPVTVERVAYYRPSNLGIAQAVVVSIGSYAIGNSLGWPSTAVSQDPSIRHDRLVPAAGAQVPPHTDRNLLLGTLPTARRAVAHGTDVWYKAAGNQYHLRIHTTTIIVKRRSC